MNNTTVKKRNLGGRPRKFDREAAIETALQRFWRQGYEGTSTTQLTAEIGISQPSLYAAFGSKEGLFKEALNLYLNKYGRFLVQALDDSGLVRDGIRQALLSAARQYSDKEHAPGCFVAMGGLQGATEHAAIQGLLAQQRRLAEEFIQQALTAAKQTNEIAENVDIDILASYFAMVIQGMAVQALDGADKAKLERMAELAMHAWPVRQ
jgi:AcrR family transcriptional regulator